MKHKIQKILKNRIFIFVLGGLLFSTVSVCAITYFDSKNVTYNNKESGLSSTNVQGAIDELYSMCLPQILIGDIILENESIITSGEGLYVDAYEGGRYFFKGKNVNNYITFNNETWRIVSIEPDKSIKIMKDASIGKQVWDTSESSDWARPADLNTYLNETYYNGLTNTAQNQTVSKKYSIGGVHGSNDINNLSNIINSENASKWSGKVALITLSEYLRSNSNQNNCNTVILNNDNHSICQNTTWMTHNNDMWTLTFRLDYKNSVFYLYNGYIYYGNTDIFVSTPHEIYPVLYIKPEIQITGGDGSQNNPYTLSE